MEKLRYRPEEQEREWSQTGKGVIHGCLLEDIFEGEIKEVSTLPYLSSRAAQYACSLLGHALQKHGASPELQKQIRQLEGHLSLGRKLLHLGNSADALESAKRAVHLSDVVLRFCITVSHLNRAMYFACDNVLWAGKSGLAPRVDQEKWAQRSFSYYLFSLIMNLSRDAYGIRLLMEQESSACSW